MLLLPKVRPVTSCGKSCLRLVTLSLPGSHINNLQLKLVNGATISLKGADRPETMRGVSLKFLVLDEYADMKPAVWEQILRPALADLKGRAMFIGTPMGRNHFYDLYQYGLKGEPMTPSSLSTLLRLITRLLDPNEIEAAKKEYVLILRSGRNLWHPSRLLEASYSKREWIKFDEDEPECWRLLHCN